MELYPVLRALHVIGVVTWIGPLLGGWWMLACADRHADVAVARWARRAFVPLVLIGHTGLLLWLGTGLLMLSQQRPYLLQGWMHAKLGVILCVVVPIEVWGMVISHGRLRGALRRAGDGPSDELEWALAAHRRLCRVSAATLIPATILILILATIRPWIS